MRGIYFLNYYVSMMVNLNCHSIGSGIQTKILVAGWVTKRRPLPGRWLVLSQGSADRKNDNLACFLSASLMSLLLSQSFLVIRAQLLQHPSTDWTSAAFQNPYHEHQVSIHSVLWTEKLWGEVLSFSSIHVTADGLPSPYLQANLIKLLCSVLLTVFLFL